MGSVVVFIIWFVIVAVIRSAVGKGKKTVPSSHSSTGRLDMNSSLPRELREILTECNEECSQKPVSLPPPHSQTVRKSVPKKKAPRTLSKDPHAGESYAAPIPAPYVSPMADKPTPAQSHAEAHIGPVEVKSSLKKHGSSATAKHADAHIATTHAVPTPRSGGARKSPLASWIPRGEADLRKALVMSEILGAPKSLR